MRKASILVFLLVLTSGLSAAGSGREWRGSIATEGVLYRLNSLHQWARGVGLDAIVPLSRRVSAQIGFMYLPSSSGHYGFHGFAADAGFLFRLSRRAAAVDLAIGGSWVNGDDSDGSLIRILGAYAGPVLRLPIGRRFGFCIRPVLRLLHIADISAHPWTLTPGISAGPALRF
jgi:hypothetical protein